MELWVVFRFRNLKCDYKLEMNSYIAPTNLRELNKETHLSIHNLHSPGHLSIIWSNILNNPISARHMKLWERLFQSNVNIANLHPENTFNFASQGTLIIENKLATCTEG